MIGAHDIAVNGGVGDDVLGTAGGEEIVDAPTGVVPSGITVVAL